MNWRDWEPYFKALCAMAKRNGWENPHTWGFILDAETRLCGICKSKFHFHSMEDVQEHGAKHLKDAGLLAFI